MGPETCTHATFIIERVTKCAFAYVKNLRLNLEFICWLFLSCALFDAKLYRKKQNWFDNVFARYEIYCSHYNFLWLVFSMFLLLSLDIAQNFTLNITF